MTNSMQASEIAARTFGNIRSVNNHLVLTVEPHVAIRLKRIFPKIPVGVGPLMLTATDENCKELLWFMERYPLAFNPPAIKYSMKDQAARFDRRALETQQGIRSPEGPVIAERQTDPEHIRRPNKRRNASEN